MQPIFRRYIGCVTSGFISAALLVGPAIGADKASPAPDFSGMWGRTTFDHEALPLGPGPMTNIIRLPTGTSDPTRPAGNYRNPILTPRAAEIVRRRAEEAVGGKPFFDPSSQCAPFTPVYSFAMQLGLQMLQSKNEITILYTQDEQIRRVRLNARHPAHVVASWMGDSVGHYEGDALVIDTIGIKTGPLAMVDRYGTPYSEALHVVERYRLIDGKTANQAAERHEKEAGRLGAAMDIDSNFGTGLQLTFTIEDANMFTVPWSAHITYRHNRGEWQELVCAENNVDVTGKLLPDIPVAQKADF